MARKSFRGEILPSTPALTARLGAQGAPFKDTELGKFVKLGTLDSQYVLCAVGDLIAGYITSVQMATSDGFSVGGVQRLDPKFAIADGSQATGTGALAIGDFVVAGTPAALGTGIGNSYAKVRKATIQPGVTAAAALGDVAPMLAMVPYLWQVVSLGSAGTGAVSTQILIERVASGNR